MCGFFRGVFLPGNDNKKTLLASKTLTSKSKHTNTVVEGMDVVKKIEAVGSASGKPSAVVEITDAGELPVKKKSFFKK